MLSCTYMYRIDQLLKADQQLFHTNDLALLWGISNRNTLYTLIKRYVGKGILFPIQKGFYSVIPINRIDSIRLGIGLLHQYAYLSTETVLVSAGIIHQDITAITLISAVSRRMEIGNRRYIARRMHDRYLYQTEGIVEVKGYLKATVGRAVADLLYFNPHYHLDEQERINWKEVKLIQKKVGFL